MVLCQLQQLNRHLHSHEHMHCSDCHAHESMRPCMPTHGAKKAAPGSSVAVALTCAGLSLLVVALFLGALLSPRCYGSWKGTPSQQAALLHPPVCQKAGPGPACNTRLAPWHQMQQLQTLSALLQLAWSQLLALLTRLPLLTCCPPPSCLGLLLQHPVACCLLL